MKIRSVLVSFLPVIMLHQEIAAQETNSKEDYSAYTAEVTNMNNFFMQSVKYGTVLTKEGLAKERAGMQVYANAKTVLKAQEKTINGKYGQIRMLIYKPDTINAVVMDIHGGSWIMGRPENDAAQNDEMARTAKVAVVSIDYHLAPEFPFPACVDDCKTAAAWLIKNVKTEFGTEKVFISGGSAGAHLAALTTIYIRDSLQAINKIKGVNLVYGCFDLGSTPSMRQVNDSTIMLNRTVVNETIKLVFTGWSAAQLQVPALSPLYANLKNLPPALFTVGTADPLIDDTYFMEDVWRRSGNKTFLAVYPACGHAFNFFPTKLARIANDRINNWIKKLAVD